MEIEFSGKVIHWRGPAPFYFIPVPENESNHLKAVSGIVSYGWGVIPVQARIGNTKFKTSLFPKDGGYLVPVKDKVRKAENLQEGDMVPILLEVAV